MTLEDIVAALPDPKLRTQAFEMAACVCMSDQDFTKKERTFLNGLREALGLELAVTESIERNLKILVTPLAAAAGPGFTPLRPYVVPMAAPAAKLAVADLDPLIRKNAILAGALEAKGDPMSGIGIAPLQRRVVARVSQLLGKELDRAKTMELLNAVGVSQAAVAPAAEASGGYLQKLFGNLSKKVPAVPEKHAFAQTYALIWDFGTHSLSRSS